MNDKFDELAKNLAQSVTRGGALKKFGFALSGFMLALSPPSWAVDLYVDANANSRSDGSISSPHARITDALERARQLRQGAAIPPTERIVIHVAPGNYVGTFNDNPLENNGNKEVLPIILNVSNLTLAGATVLDHDALGLPTGPSNGPQTKLKSGTTLTDPGQSLILVVRTTDGGAGDSVTITGFTLEENGSFDSPGQTAIFVDRVSDFAIVRNAFLHTPVGCLTRLASGTIEDNSMRCQLLGAAIHGGSVNRPAVVTLRRNRATGGNAGADIRGMPSMRLLNVGANALTIEPLQTTYDRNNPTEVANVPDTLDVLVEGNDFSDNFSYGLWCFGFAPFFGYTTSDPMQPLTSVVWAAVTGNIFADNGHYGVAVEPVGSFRNNPRRFLSSFTGRFEDNLISGNGRSAAFFSFVPADVSLGSASIQDFKYLQDSIYQVTDPNGELAGFDYDNPVTDSVSGATLNNVLHVNGATVPPGVKITSLKK